MRKVTIINSRTQSQSVIENSNATTLGELKAEMRREGINYEGMTFYEGHLRAELQDDASVLPEQIPYKGRMVSDLVFMLTTPNKKIESGLGTQRTDLFVFIKQHNLQDDVYREFGKNMTQVKTESLQKFVDDWKDMNGETTPKTTEEEDIPQSPVKNECHCQHNASVEERLDNIESILNDLVEALWDNDAIEYGDYAKLKADLPVTEKKSKNIPQDEVDEMFDFLNK